MKEQVVPSGVRISGLALAMLKSCSALNCSFPRPAGRQIRIKSSPRWPVRCDLGRPPPALRTCTGQKRPRLVGRPSHGARDADRLFVLQSRNCKDDVARIVDREALVRDQPRVIVRILGRREIAVLEAVRGLAPIEDWPRSEAPLAKGLKSSSAILAGSIPCRNEADIAW